MSTQVDFTAMGAPSERAVEYLEYILEQNQKHNLTAITNYEEACTLHLADSLVPLQYILLNILPNYKGDPFTYCDMGTGAGFPGVPLALALLENDVNLRTVLLDATAKKVRIVNRWLQAEGLEASVHAQHCRIEEYQNVRKQKEEALPPSFDLLTARSLSNLNSLLELATPLLAPNGHFLAYKGKLDKAELLQGNRLAFELGLEQFDTISCTLENDAERNVLVYRKTRKSRKELPRRVGMAQHKPLNV